MTLGCVPAEHFVGRNEEPAISQRSSGTPCALMRIDLHPEAFGIPPERKYIFNSSFYPYNVPLGHEGKFANAE
jgi:hypothetical protein